jgi:hypothetical protein
MPHDSAAPEINVRINIHLLLIIMTFARAYFLKFGRTLNRAIQSSGQDDT